MNDKAGQKQRTHTCNTGWHINPTKRGPQDKFTQEAQAETKEKPTPGMERLFFMLASYYLGAHRLLRFQIRADVARHLRQ